MELGLFFKHGVALVHLSYPMVRMCKAIGHQILMHTPSTYAYTETYTTFTDTQTLSDSTHTIQRKDIIVM